MMTNRYLFSIILFIQFLIAGTTGKVTGLITDKETGEPLIGCNVIIMDTDLGTASNQGADLSDGLARNIYCYVNVNIGSNIFLGANTDHVIAETIVFNKEDATTRILCEGYLAHKYGRQDRLAATHKYRYGPPRV